LRNARSLLRVAVLAALAVGVLVPSTPVAAATKPTLQQQIDQQATALEKVVEQYNKINGQRVANGVKQKQLAALLGPTLEKLTASKAQVASIVKTTYMAGKLSTFNTLLNAGDTTGLLNEMTTLDQVASVQRKEMEGLEQLNSTYLSQKAEVDNLIRAETAQQATLAAQKKVIQTKLAALYKLRTEAYGRATTPSGGSHPAPPYVAGRAGKIVNFAYAQLGKPYVWAADGPGSYDCSGLVMAAYRTVGISLPHNAAQQWGRVSHISRSALKPGDLVFYSGLGHVAIYVGSGKVIHAPQAGENVSLASVDMMTPYGYGRV
jgi:cell wall-associated NlpC family hydrolase